MRGDDRRQGSMFSYLSLEQRVPESHPLQPLRAMVDQALVELSPAFEGLYSRVGRPSIAPEKLLRALLLQVLYTIRSERMLGAAPRGVQRLSQMPSEPDHLLGVHLLRASELCSGTSKPQRSTIFHHQPARVPRFLSDRPGRS